MRMLNRGFVFLTVVLFILVSASTAGACPAVSPGRWWADYFSNPDLSGSPVVSRYDDAINFDWGTGSPANELPADNFSVRWVRDEWFSGGTYRFEVHSDDGVRLWVDNVLVVDEWRDRQPTPIIVDHPVAAGTHRVRVEYYERTGGALISVGWSRLVGGAAWRGEYYANRDLSGWPVLVRNDRAIDFEWGDGSPDPALPADNFSVRWTRTVGFDAGTYRFFTSTDDGARVWVDGKLVVDAWRDQKQLNTHTGDIYLTAGQHNLVVEYYEHGGAASAHVWWKPLDSYANWHGEYFDNRDFIGGPVLVRGDAGINFDWGTGAPVDWMPDDNFSVRWSRTVNFTPGYYRFVVRADDGVRVWLDGYPIIDRWQDMDYELHYVDGTYLQGAHTIKVEYYERNGNARVHFWWEQGSDADAPPSFVPTSVPQGAGPVAGDVTETWPDGPWQASYFDNASLQGDPVLTRVEKALDLNWGLGSPGDGVPNDHFSARWTRSLDFQGGLYRFTTYTDDGVRLWVDGKLVINSWRPMRGYRSATVRLEPGTHEIKMEYYERTGVALARLTWRRVSR
ncbi:MAG TPA: hypothetical protein ENN99_14110 [Chloroflexi bacterium]|nr:hypothetical protein [Chloroflexota bacterium]